MFLPSDYTQSFDYTTNVHLESWIDESGTSTIDTPSRTSTTSYSINSHSVYDETTTNSGTIDFENGDQTITGTLVVDAYGNFDGHSFETTSYLNRFSDSTGSTSSNYESGTDTYSGDMHYNGSLTSTTPYVDGDYADQTFTFHELLISTATQNGSGTAHYDNSSGETTDTSILSFSYGSSATTTSNASASGAIGQALQSGNTVTTLQANVTSSSSVDTNSHGNSTITFNRSDSTTSTSGTSTSSFSSSSSASLGEQASVSRTRDKYRVTGTGFSSISASASESTGTSGTYHEDTDSYTTNISFSSRTGASGGGGSSTDYSFTNTDEGSRSSGVFSTYFGVGASEGYQATGTHRIKNDSEPDVIVPIRNNEADTYGLTITNDGSFVTDTLDTDNPQGTYKVTGHVDRIEQFTTRTSSYASSGGKLFIPGTDAPGLITYPYLPGQEPVDYLWLGTSSTSFSLEKTYGKSTNHQDYDYTDDNGALSRKGVFDTDDEFDRETIDQVAHNYTDLTAGTSLKYYSREDTGAASEGTSDGTFSEAPGATTADAKLDSTQKASAGSRDYLESQTDKGDGNRSFYKSFSNGSGQNKLSGDGTASLDNGELTTSAGKSESNTWGNSLNGGQTLDEQTTTETSGDVTIERYTFDESNGETRGNSRNSASGSGSGQSGGNSTESRVVSSTDTNQGDRSTADVSAKEGGACRRQWRLQVGHRDRRHHPRLYRNDHREGHQQRG